MFFQGSYDFYAIFHNNIRDLVKSMKSKLDSIFILLTELYSPEAKRDGKKCDFLV